MPTKDRVVVEEEEEDSVVDMGEGVMVEEGFDAFLWMFYFRGSAEDGYIYEPSLLVFILLVVQQIRGSLF